MRRLVTILAALAAALLAGACFLSPQPEPPDLTDMDATNGARQQDAGGLPGADEGDGDGIDDGSGWTCDAGAPSGYCNGEGDGSAEPPCPCDDLHDPDCDSGGAVTNPNPDYNRFRRPPRPLPDSDDLDGGLGDGDVGDYEGGDAGLDDDGAQAVDY